MRTVFIECDRDLPAPQQRKAMIAEMEYAAGDDVRIVLLAPGMHVAEPAQRWIPCSERLPEVGDYVICSQRNRDVGEGCLLPDGMWHILYESGTYGPNWVTATNLTLPEVTESQTILVPAVGNGPIRMFRIRIMP